MQYRVIRRITNHLQIYSMKESGAMAILQYSNGRNCFHDSRYG